MNTFRNTLIAGISPSLYLLAVAMLAALLAYPLFRLSGSEDVSLYRTLVSRGGQALIILGFYPIFRKLGLEWRDFGLKRRFFGQCVIGFLVGATMLLLHMIALILMDVRVMVWEKLNPHDLMPILGKSLAIGLGVALLEESIFRGALMAIIRRLSGPMQAVGISAFYYAILHFIGTKWTTESGLIGWDTGFRIALDGFSHLAEVDPDSFLGLLVAGLFLATLRSLIPMSLGICMGIHAGWVFIIKSFKSMSYPNFDSSLLYFVSPYDQITGYFSSVWLGAILILIWLFVARQRRSPVPSPQAKP